VGRLDLNTMRYGILRLFVLAVLSVAVNGGCSKNDTPVGSGPPAAPAPMSQNNYGQSPAVASQAEASANTGGTYFGTINLDPKLAGKIDPNAVLFISAKPAEGPQSGVAPVAAQRVPNPKFPLQYTLTQADVIMPGATLSGQFNIVAKLMKNGAAGPMGPGDIEGKYSKNPVAPGGKAVDITLDTLH
jgi:cytochrome c-type biogenesis protein CcmH